MPEWEGYIKTVTSQIKLPFDRAPIAQELSNHLDDIYEDLCNQGKSQEEATVQALAQMGNGKILGQALNQVHHPVIGWVWYVARLCLIFCVIINLYPMLILGFSLVSMPFSGYSDYYDKEVSPVTYTMDVDKTVEIYDLSLTIDQLNYHQDGTLEVRYKTFQNPLAKAMTWSYNIICLADETGMEYYGGGSSSGGIISHHQTQLDNFPLERTMLRVQYADQKWLEIPIEWEAVV